MVREVEVAVIGAGSAGLTAFFVVKKTTKDCVLINGGEVGTTCARVGCMPSKVGIHVADSMHHPKTFGRYGIEGGKALSIDQEEALEYIRDMRDDFVDGVLAGTIDEFSDEEFIEGYAQFVDVNTLQVGEQTIKAKKIVIATGSSPVLPEAWKAFGDKVITTDQLFELEVLLESMAVIGLGVIGLELGQMLSRLGVNVTGVDQLDVVAHLADPVVAKVAEETFAREFPLWLGQPATVEAEGDQLKVTSGEQSVLVDCVFATMGRTQNLSNLGLDKIGVDLDEYGMPSIHPETMQIGDLPIFMAGDVIGDRPLLHEANDEGRIAGFNATNEITRFKRKTPLMITFTDPNIVIAGKAFDEVDADEVVIGEMRMAPIGRARILGSNRGVIRVYAEKATGKLVGMTMMGVRGEHIAHLMAWAIQQEMTVADILKMPFYHPVIEEGLQAALNQAYAQLPEQEKLVSMTRL